MLIVFVFDMILRLIWIKAFDIFVLFCFVYLIKIIILFIYFQVHFSFHILYFYLLVEFQYYFSKWQLDNILETVESQFGNWYVQCSKELAMEHWLLHFCWIVIILWSLHGLCYIFITHSHGLCHGQPVIIHGTLRRVGHRFTVIQASSQGKSIPWQSFGKDKYFR